MANNEVASYSEFICASCDRIVNTLDGLNSRQLNWRPPAAGANSVYAIVSHALATVESYVLNMVCGQRLPEDASAGWKAEGDSAEPLREHWQDLRQRVQSSLATLSPADMDQERDHPRRGKMPARELLLMVNRHTGEHIGHAELTRDLVKAARD